MMRLAPFSGHERLVDFHEAFLELPQTVLAKNPRIGEQQQKFG
jgi:hypothetical protein